MSEVLFRINLLQSRIAVRTVASRCPTPNQHEKSDEPAKHDGEKPQLNMACGHDDAIPYFYHAPIFLRLLLHRAGVWGTVPRRVEWGSIPSHTKRCRSSNILPTSPQRDPNCSHLLSESWISGPGSSIHPTKQPKEEHSFLDAQHYMPCICQPKYAHWQGIKLNRHTARDSKVWLSNAYLWGFGSRESFKPTNQS